MFGGIKKKSHFISLHLYCEVLHAGVQQRVEVLPDRLLDEVGVEAAGDHAEADEGRQQRAGPIRAQYHASQPIRSQYYLDLNTGLSGKVLMVSRPSRLHSCCGSARNANSLQHTVKIHSITLLEPSLC